MVQNEIDDICGIFLTHVKSAFSAKRPEIFARRKKLLELWFGQTFKQLRNS